MRTHQHIGIVHRFRGFVFHHQAETRLAMVAVTMALIGAGVEVGNLQARFAPLFGMALVVAGAAVAYYAAMFEMKR
jgi:hypothetical protein